MFVVVRFVNEQGINAHIVKVCHIIGLTVKHCLCMCFGIGSLLCRFFRIFLSGFLAALARHIIRFEVFTQILQLFLHSVGYLLVKSCLFGGFDSVYFLLYLLIDKVAHTALAVGYHIEYRLRNDNQVPIIVFYLGVELLSALSCAVTLANR